ncbi:MAG: hypothetical protein OSA51_07240 [Octadecabacter sp.]|nr:hypothetical protein [Octadecabacter sp.]
MRTSEATLSYSGEEFYTPATAWIDMQDGNFAFGMSYSNAMILVDTFAIYSAYWRIDCLSNSPYYEEYDIFSTQPLLRRHP